LTLLVPGPLKEAYGWHRW